MDNNKKFSISSFVTFFAKTMIEVFIPIILFNRGFSIKEILTYMSFQYFFSIIITYLIPKIDDLIKYKGLIIINTIFFIVTYLFLFNMNNSILNLALLALFHTIHTTIFWILRHIYMIKIYPMNNLSKSVGNILIITELAFLISSYIGAFILEKYNNMILVIISGILLTIGNIILIFTKIEDVNTKINFSILKSIPKRNILFFILEQFKVIAAFIFPLYLTIYLKVDYKFIGLFNILISISSIIFIFVFSRIINKKKKSYLFITALMYSILWILKININIKTIILVIALLEGIVSKLYQTSVTRFLYALGKHYDTLDYVTITEILFNVIRLLITLIIILLIDDLKIILYICTVGLFLTGLVKFNDLND